MECTGSKNCNFNNMIIQSGQKQSDRFITEVSEIEVRQSVESHREVLRPAQMTPFILFLIGVVSASVACGQTVSRKSLVGTWCAPNNFVKFAEDGTVESGFTNRTHVLIFEGRWLTRDNTLVLTTTKSNGVPCHDVSNFKVIRADGNHLVYSIDGQTMTFIRKGAESKSPQISPALEKAKKIKLSTVKFDSLPLSVVITMLHDESVKRDAARKGITISLAPDAKQLAGAEINLDLRDVTLSETLERVAGSVGLEMQATNTEIFLVRKKAAETIGDGLPN